MLDKIMLGRALISCGSMLLGFGMGQYHAGRKLPFLPWGPLAVAAVVLGFLPGCAALPIPFQPANQQYNSNMAEGSWLVLDAIDTAQTMHINASNPTCSYEADPMARLMYGTRNPTPSRVLLTNLVLATAHTMVTSWLDDEVAKHDAANDGSVGPWYVGRVLWHGVSLLATSASVITNHRNGCAL